MNLNPNCSEAIFKIGKQEIGVLTDSYPNSALEYILDEMKTGKEKYTFVENCGGGANFDYIENVVKLARKVRQGEITEKEAKEKDKKLWGL